MLTNLKRLLVYKSLTAHYYSTAVTDFILDWTINF